METPIFLFADGGALQLATIDWVIIAGYFLIVVAIGLAYARRASASMSEFFISGRSLPWWIAGTSMVATTFAADTPLAIVSLLVKHGLAGNWFWWSFAIGGMITVFVYSRLWRRSEVMTDVELIQIRYDGRAARMLRYLRAIYVALVINPIVIGWVVGAMVTVLEETLFFDHGQYSPDAFWNQQTLVWAVIVGMMVVVGIYSTLAGMWGVAIADSLQFCVAMVGCIWLAWIAVDHAGGIVGLRTKVQNNFGSEVAFDFFPSFKASSQPLDFPDLQANPEHAATATLKMAAVLHNQDQVVGAVKLGVGQSMDRLSLALQNHQAAPPTEQSKSRKKLKAATVNLQSSIRKATPGPWMLIHVFLIWLTLQWWATWYPGAEPGGGGYVVQRMASCKDERHAILATLWFQIAHYCLRPWPWIMIGFAALALHPELRTNYIADDAFDPGVGFPMVMRQFCGPGLAGLMIVAFFAAFMSTISTQMNWGASYLVRDFVQPLLLPNADQNVLTRVSRLVSVAMLAIGLVAAFLMNGVSVDNAWKLLAALGSGTGLVFMLRWFWWRINAWSEISAMIASLVFFSLLSLDSVQGYLFGDYRIGNEERMALVAGLTIVTWIATTFVTRPESPAVLATFYRKIRPGGPGWQPMAAANPDIQCESNLGWSFVVAILGSGIVYFVLPMVGYLIFGHYAWAVVCFVGATGCSWGVHWALQKTLADSDASSD